MRSRLALAVLSWALGGCSGGDHPAPLDEWRALPECPDHDYSTCDNRNAQCQARLLSLAGCLFGVDAPPDVPIRVISEEALLQELETDAAAQQDPTDLPGVPHVQNTLVDLGLVERESLTGAGPIAEIVDSIDGVYLDAERGILLVDRGRPQNNVDSNALLLHELIHAIQDAEYDLDSWRDQQLATADTSLALRSVTEGQATFYQFRALVAMSGYDIARVDFEQTFDKLRDDLTTDAHADPSPYLASITTFPYGFGVGLAYQAWRSDGRLFHVSQFAEPPLSTYEVMRQNVAPDMPSIVPSEPPEPTAIADYTLVDQSVLGAFLLELFLVKHGIDGYSAREVALTWRGDKLWIYGGPSEETAWLWELELESDRDAVNFESVQALPRGVTLERQSTRAFIAGGSDQAPFVLDAGRAFLNAAD